MSIRSWVGLAIAVLLSAPLGGCATLVPAKIAKRQAAGKRDDTAAPRQRREAAVREFEIKRNQAQYEAAISRWHENDVVGCRQNLTQLLARDPRHVAACLLWAELTLEAESVDRQGFDEAVDKLQACVAHDPDDPKVHHMLGLLWEAQGREAEALASFERALQLSPDDKVFQVSYETARGELGVAVQAASPSDLSESVTATDQTGAKHAKQKLAAKGRTSHRDKRVELVIGRLTTDITAASGQLATRELIRKADASLAAGDTTQAVLWFERAIASEPTNVQIPLQAALKALQHEQTDLAIALCAGQAEQFPRSAPLQLALGIAYYRQADFNSAQSALQQALSLDKRGSLSYFLMGSTHEQLGNSDAAATHFARAAELDSTLVRR